MGAPISLRERQLAGSATVLDVPFDERHASLETLLARLPATIWAISPDGVVLLGRGASTELTGKLPCEVVGRSVFELFGDLPELVTDVRRALAGESISAIHEVDGIAVAFSFEPVAGNDGQWIGAAGIAIDVSQSERAKVELVREQRRMRDVLLAHERDRRLIAYEIHDGPVQNMTGAQMCLESLLASDTASEQSTRERLTLASTLLREAIDESRRVINGLRPPILDTLGIVPAIEHLVSEQAEGGLTFELEVEGELGWLDPLVEGTVYRIVQEAVSNARRHSLAERAAIQVSRANERIHLEIRDWGIGFNPACVEDNRLGLRGIRERARLLNGWASIESTPGEGTRVVVDLPIAAVPG